MSVCCTGGSLVSCIVGRASRPATTRTWHNRCRFWSNALAQTAPGEGKADAYEYNTKLGIPITKSAA